MEFKILFEDDVTEGVAEGVVFVRELEGGGGFGTSRELLVSHISYLDRKIWW